MDRDHYSPPWADMSIIGVAGASGSGKTSLALEIIRSLNLPWVVILSMDSFYKSLNAEQQRKAHLNEYDFDAPDAIDFDILVERLSDLKHGRRVEIPVYSFEQHQRLEKTTSIYSPHVLILEGIFALYDERVLDLMDLKIFAEAEADLCLSRRIKRDVRERARDIEGIIKQWFAFVKPNFLKHVEPQREVADIIIPRGIENRVAIDMVVKHIQQNLKQKSRFHQAELKRLGQVVSEEHISPKALLVKETPQIRAMNTILQDPDSDPVDFIFCFDRLAALLLERALDTTVFEPFTITTPLNLPYNGLAPAPSPISAVVLLRAGSCFEASLRRVLPDCKTGRLLIQTDYRTGEPELHFLKLSLDIAEHQTVMLLDPQMSSGGAALMAVRVLVDHGVKEENIVFVTYIAGTVGVNRVLKCFPGLRVVMGGVVKDEEERWVERRYFGC